MRIIKAGFEILTPIDGMQILKHIERVGRVCYKSEDKITDDSCIGFVQRLINRGHEAMIEHFSISVLFTCDRGVSHEIVRHRIASFAQESTRYCNYGKADEITLIYPCFYENPQGARDVQLAQWEDSCMRAESAYLEMLRLGAQPQEARSVLPNSLKTEIVMTANLREWRHFFHLRTAEAAHPQMREITIPLLEKFRELIPVVFDEV